jgi:uncharacterized membrane protein
METHAMQSLFAALVMPSHTNAEILGIFLRWLHILAAVTWVGLLYFFNFINLPFMKHVDAAARPTIFQKLTMPALEWFRWSALLTVFMGFWYWSQIYVAASAHLEGKSPLGTIGLFLLIWVVAWHVIFAAVRRTPNPWVLAVIVAVVVVSAAWLFLRYIPVGGNDNHVLCIGIGGGLGWIMGSNVLAIIFKNNKKIIDGTLAGSPPANAAVLARQAFLASRMNLYLSFPMLFFMTAASHFPLFGS